MAKPIYRITSLKPNLVLIQWFGTPQNQASIVQEWLNALWDIVHQATEPVYFVSDLRHGCVADVRALKELAAIANHPKCAVGVGFSKSISSEVYANLFARLSKDEHPMADSLEAALKMIEAEHPGLTTDVDWQAALDQTATT